MDVVLIIQNVLTVIGGITVVLGVIAPLTKTDKDDKVLRFLKKIMSFTAKHLSDDGKVTVSIKDKK